MGVGVRVRGKHCAGGHACCLVVRTAAHRQHCRPDGTHSQLPRHGVTPSCLKRGTPMPTWVRVSGQALIAEETRMG